MRKSFSLLVSFHLLLVSLECIHRGLFLGRSTVEFFLECDRIKRALLLGFPEKVHPSADSIRLLPHATGRSLLVHLFEPGESILK